MRPLGRFLIVATTLFLGWWSGSVWGAEWVMPSGYPDGSMPVASLRLFAGELAKQGCGIRIQVRPSDTGGRPGNIWEAVRRGAVPAGMLIASGLADVDPLFSLDSLPFLATDFAGSRRLYQAARPYLQQRLAAHGIELLYAVPWPPQGLFSDRPIDSAQALHGLRFRTYNPTTTRLAAMLETLPRSVDGSELPAALATRQIQAMFSSAASGVDFAVWRYFSHFYDLRGWLPLNLVIASRSALNALPEEDRVALKQAAARAEEQGWQASATLHESSLAALAAKGIIVQSPSLQLKEDLSVLGGALTNEWLSSVGRDGISVINAMAR